MTLKTDGSFFSRWRNVDNDSADVTSESRSKVQLPPESAAVLQL